MDTPIFLKEQFEKLQATDANELADFRQQAFQNLEQYGIPTLKHEEWRYTRVNSLFNKDYEINSNTGFTWEQLADKRLPDYQSANELVFVNGVYNAALSNVISADLEVLPLSEASSAYKTIVDTYLGHSADYLKDGINALSSAFVHGGVFIQVKRSKAIEHPVYIYNVAVATDVNVLAQPRSLVYLQENAQLTITETNITIGSQQSFTNKVIEIVLEKDANLSYFLIQNDTENASQVSTTHIRHIGTSYSKTVTISLDGALVRNNLNIILEAPHCESHMYGLSLLSGKTHVDNHTIVDNRQPDCFSNELYKGLFDGNSTGVFNGKIFVQQIAQKTNAFQSNKNILLSDGASVNTKPQLEIFADNVKCSHGCTIGQLDEEALFYLQSRGITENSAKAMLLHGFAIDVLDNITNESIKNHVDAIISKRLNFDLETI